MNLDTNAPRPEQAKVATPPKEGFRQEVSSDVSDYGSYDTSQIEKEVMVTVKASFTLN
jgi:hypothetical protein